MSKAWKPVARLQLPIKETSFQKSPENKLRRIYIKSMILYIIFVKLYVSKSTDYITVKKKVFFLRFHFFLLALGLNVHKLLVHVNTGQQIVPNDQDRIISPTSSEFSWKWLLKFNFKIGSSSSGCEDRPINDLFRLHDSIRLVVSLNVDQVFCLLIGR